MTARSKEWVGLRPLSCWDYGLESRLGHGYLSIVSGVCFRAEFCTTARLHSQRSPTACGVPECHCGTSAMRSPRTTRAVQPCSKINLASVSTHNPSIDSTKRSTPYRPLSVCEIIIFLHMHAMYLLSAKVVTAIPTEAEVHFTDFYLPSCVRC